VRSNNDIEKQRVCYSSGVGGVIRPSRPPARCDEEKGAHEAIPGFGRRSKRKSPCHREVPGEKKGTVGDKGGRVGGEKSLA